MFAWIEVFYARLRPLMDEAKRDALDWHLGMGGYAIPLADCIEFAVARDLLTDDDRIHIEQLLDFGLLRPAKAYFKDLIAA